MIFQETFERDLLYNNKQLTVKYERGRLYEFWLFIHGPDFSNAAYGSKYFMDKE